MCETLCTYLGVCNTMKCVHPFFDNNPLHTTQVCNKTKTWCQRLTILYVHLHLQLVPMTHHLYVQLQMGFGLGTLHSPPPYLCIVLSALYTHVHTKFQKSSKRCGYSTHIASSCSQVASLGPYQVHWTFTSSMARFRVV
jgi:hypothetical protein